MELCSPSLCTPFPSIETRSAGRFWPSSRCREGRVCARGKMRRVRSGVAQGSVLEPLRLFRHATLDSFPLDLVFPLPITGNDTTHPLASLYHKVEAPTTFALLRQDMGLSLLLCVRGMLFRVLFSTETGSDRDDTLFTDREIKCLFLRI